MKQGHSKYWAEGLGTFFMVLAGTGSILVDRMDGGSLGVTGIGLVFGLAVMVLIYALGHISGAHFNPAVTLGFYLGHRFPGKEVAPYLASQFAGAACASFLLAMVLGMENGLGATLPRVAPIHAFLLEVLQTFLLMFVIMAVATDSRAVGEMAGLAIGGTVALNAIWAGPLTGASMNPARSLGPALATGNLEGLWIYMLGPLAGAVAAAWAYNRIRCEKPISKGSAGCC